MSRLISLFSGYSQGENRTTNYCLLVLKMLYEENPKFLAEVMTTLVGEELGEQIGVRFRQQIHKTSSTPDGLIVQPAFAIYIETKNWDWFRDEQLEQHLSSLHKETEGLKVLVALANFEAEESEKFDRIRGLCAQKYKDSITFKEVSFEDFTSALMKIPHLPKNLDDVVQEFRAYLDEEYLLPSWERKLDVVNCAGIPDDVLSGKVYMCPAVGGAYSHIRCKYFGMYRDKRIERVGLIEAVVDVEDDHTARVKWQNMKRSKQETEKLAIEKVGLLLPGTFPTRVFLLGELFETDCKKDSPGGMYNSKRYFDVSWLDVTDAADLAGKIKGVPWSKFESTL
jgi:hypothetical protein